MTEISEDEAQALRDVAGAEENQVKRLVLERNFSQPRRLSADRLQRISQTVGASLQDISTKLAAPLRSFFKFHVGSISEVNANGLFQDTKSPFMVICLDINGTLGWLVWDETAATATLEQILSGELDPEEEIKPRVLSPAETRVLEQLLTDVVQPVGQCLGLNVKIVSVAQEEEELTTLRDAGPDADARRLMLHLVFEGPGGDSDLRLYLPNIDEDGDGTEATLTQRVPEHLDTVHMEMRALLGKVEIPLRDLLAMEVGDVIPLGTEVGGKVNFLVEDRPVALCDWGQVGGALTLKITELNTENLQ
ncbi:MAG: FliM/FliN family flagellar motor switch protein [Planctomycetota bacterium]|nr:FliM/FliN family flagellar motor switch protein [Planctomycetota bacterium]